MSGRLEEAIRREKVEKNRPSGRTVFIPGEDPGAFGRRAARDLFDQYVKDRGSSTRRPKQS